MTFKWLVRCKKNVSVNQTSNTAVLAIVRTAVTRFQIFLTLIFSLKADRTGTANLDKSF